MKLGERLVEFRGKFNMAQEDLAEKLYVSRQTISSWENDKSYPDIHSLLMMSELFGVSLDELIKGDIEIMKEKVNQSEINDFKRESNIFAVLLIVSVASFIPLYDYLKIPGLVLWGILFAITLYYAFKIERIKKQHDIYTYKEIVAFTKGEKLDGIQKAREEGKRIYEPIVLFVGSALITAIIMIIIHYVLKLF